MNVAIPFFEPPRMTTIKLLHSINCTLHSIEGHTQIDLLTHVHIVFVFVTTSEIKVHEMHLYICFGFGN